MDESRRDFLRKAAVTVAPLTAVSGCVTEGKDETIDALYIEADPEELHTEVDGHNIYVNLMSYAEDESLEELRMEYREPGEDAWKILDEREADGEKLHIQESFSTDQEGEYMFRSIASTGQQEYISEIEEVNFL